MWRLRRVGKGYKVFVGKNQTFVSSKREKKQVRTKF